MPDRIRTLRWLGSKARHLDFILPLLPRTRVYVEPFGGSAAVLINRPRSSTEVYSDADPMPVALLRTARDRPSELADAISLTPYSRTEFRCAMRHEFDPGSAESARLAHVLVHQSFSGARASFGRLAEGRMVSPLPVRPLHRRLQGVEILNRDALDVIREYDSPDTLFYLDPPYVSGSRATDSRAYRFEYSDTDHSGLLDLIIGLDGMVALSGYASDMYRSALDGWREVSGAERPGMVNNNRQRRDDLRAGNPDAARARSTECVWLNY